MVMVFCHGDTQNYFYEVAAVLKILSHPTFLSAILSTNPPVTAMQMSLFLFSLLVKQNISRWQAFAGTAWSHTYTKHRPDFDSSAFFNGCLFPPDSCQPTGLRIMLQQFHTQTYIYLQITQIFRYYCASYIMSRKARFDAHHYLTSSSAF